MEAFLYGVYIALVFVPLFNYFEGAKRSEAATPGPVHSGEAMARR